MSSIDIKITVIIVSYNNLQVLIDCVESIKKYNDIKEQLEVIIVDNSTTNFIYEYMKENYKWINIMKNENNGFGQGNNVGAKIARGEFLIFLNPDTILIEPIFSFTLEKFREHTTLALFGLKLLNTELGWNMSYYFLDKHSFISGQIIRLLNKYNVFLKNKMFISGANIFIRKQSFFEVGLFDENIFMYYEESDLIKRVKKLGGEIAYFKEKKIIHLEGKTVSCSEESLKNRLKSASYYSRKYNLNFIKQLRSEIRYNQIKYILYKLFNREKTLGILKTIKILREFGE